MEPLANYVKNINSSLYERRLAIIILKKYSYGRRSFSETAKTTKIKPDHRERHYEPEAQTKESIANKEKETLDSPRIGYSYGVETEF